MVNRGFKIGEKQLLQEFEFEGKKVFKNVPHNPFFIDGVPACYLMYVELGPDFKWIDAKPKM